MSHKKVDKHSQCHCAYLSTTVDRHRQSVSNCTQQRTSGLRNTCLMSVSNKMAAASVSNVVNQEIIGRKWKQIQPANRCSGLRVCKQITLTPPAPKPFILSFRNIYNNYCINNFGPTVMWFMHKNTPFVSFKAVFSVDIPLLKSYCWETSKLLYASRWRKILHISLSNISEDDRVLVTEFYDLSYWNETPNKAEIV